MKLSYLDLMTSDPSYNLAMEQYVFDCLPRDRMYFMLWQNDNAIIVGKYQNTIAEINEEAVRERGIRVVRRLSGGGAVYHDMGNLNFTFITDVGESNALDLKLFCEPVVRTLATLGVKAEVNGRNDITIDGKKFSGNSQYIRQGRVMHHGTIMFDSDLSVVSEALRVDPTKIQTKGIRSVRSRVTNVAEHLPEKVTLPEFRRILLENILKENPGEAYPLTQDDLAAVEAARGALCHLGVELRKVSRLHDAAPPPRGRLRPDRGLHHRGARKDRGPDIQGRLLQRLGTGRAGGALCWLHAVPRGL
jgi:lipoate-protein ligase A